MAFWNKELALPHSEWPLPQEQGPVLIDGQVARIIKGAGAVTQLEIQQSTTPRASVSEVEGNTMPAAS